jgi:prephenate dehydrogenase
MEKPLFDKVVIGGVGLMGGALGSAIHKQGLAKSVWGYGRNPERLKNAQDRGHVDRFTTEVRKAARDADLVVVCFPVRLVPKTVLEFAEVCPPEAVLTDVGSTKAELVAEIETDLPESGPAFVGSHPMCGSERSGFEYARDDLYEGATCVITPTLTTPESAIRKVRRLWKGVGGKTLLLEPVEHDRLAARTSHLPRVVSAALCHALEREMDAELRDLMVSTGFLGATRTAASDEETWTQIVTSNRDHLLDALGDMQACLNELHEILSEQDAKGLKQWLAEGRAVRQRLGGDSESGKAG